MELLALTVSSVLKPHSATHSGRGRCEGPGRKIKLVAQERLCAELTLSFCRSRPVARLNAVKPERVLQQLTRRPRQLPLTDGQQLKLEAESRTKPASVHGMKEAAAHDAQ